MLTTKIEKIYRSEKKKDGTPLVTKAGKPYQRIAIQVTQHGDRWLSGFGNSINSGWVVGQMISIIVEESGEYLNFKTPEKVDILEERIEKIEKEIEVLRTFMPNVKPSSEPLTQGNQEPEISISEIPF